MTAARQINSDVDAALDEARAAFTTRHAKSLNKHIEAAKAMPGGNTRTTLYATPFPITLVKGDGAYVFDLDGNRYIDLVGEYTAGIYGHSHPVIRKAIDRALDGGINLGGHNMMEAQLAQAVVDRIPSIELVRFTNSGTEANLMAISAARIHTGRKKVLVINGGYHGAVFYFTGGGSPINAPFDFVLATYNDIPGTKALIEKNASELACVILEPMLGGGGCIPADKAFLQMLRDETKRIGAILIFDEVMTSRLSPGGLQQVHGITPDMTTLGKYIGGGMSFGAFGGRLDIMSRFDPRKSDALPHAGTFNNNVLTMSAGLAGMTEVYTPEAARALNARGEALRARLNELSRKHGAKLQWTGIGSMLTGHFTLDPIRSPGDAAKADQRLKELAYFDLVARGIWIAKRLMMALCLPITDKDCDEIVAAVDEFLTARGPLVRA
jgi:glutamate-1-semialdehyde 2,1-aminomutase